MQDKAKEIVKKYLGIPFVHAGRGMDGLDCWGLMLRVYADLGHKLWDTNEIYDETWKWEDKSLFIENYHRQWEKVEKPGIFDGVLFKSMTGVSKHCGIVVDDMSFIHAARGFGVIKTRLGDPIWSQIIEGYYRLKELKL